MRTGRGFIIWTAMLLHISVIKGQMTDSPPALSAITPLNEVIPDADHVTSQSVILESKASSAYQSLSNSPTDSLNPEVTPAVSPSSQPTKDTVLHSDTSPSPGISQTPTAQDVSSMETATVPAVTFASSPSLSNVKSTISQSVATTAPATSNCSDEEHQTSSALTSSVPSTTQTALSITPSYSTPSQFPLTASSKVTGPAPLEDQNDPSELDVGDVESDKVQPASPLDPLLAALVSIFIISTAMVSVVLFLRFRQRSEHPEFHRLQDLPMDDLLEDTPLSRYNY